MSLFSIGFLLVSPVLAQSTGVGSTTITGTLDTRLPFPAITGPAPAAKRPRVVLSPAERAARQPRSGIARAIARCVAGE